MVFEINKKPKVTVKIYEQVYELSRPTMAMADAFEAAAQDPKDSYKKLMGFVCELGLPVDVAQQMEVEDFQNLFTHMMPKKKD